MKAKYLDWLANAQKISVAKLIGNNRKFIECVKMATITANAISPLLICGETGTGKELFAQIVHYEGGRANKPFGTVKGAFTGAADWMGLLEQANSGTIYLNELNSMPMSLQAKLLRVLEDKKVRRVGNKAEAAIDAHIVSSFGKSNGGPSCCTLTIYIRG